MKQEVDPGVRARARATHLYATLRGHSLSPNFPFEAAMNVLAELRSLSFELGDPVGADRAGLARRRLRDLKSNSTADAVATARRVMGEIDANRYELQT